MPKGNRTQRRGVKLRRDIRLTDAATEKLRRVWRIRSGVEPGLTEDEIVNDLIMQMAEPIADTELEQALYGPRHPASVAADCVRDMGGAEHIQAKEEKPIIL